MPRNKVAEIFTSFLDAPWVAPCERHVRALEEDCAHCSCLHAGEQDSNMRQFIEKFVSEVSSKYRLKPNSLIAYAMGPVRNGSGPTNPHFEFYAYRGASSYPRPVPHKLLKSDGAFRNMLGRDDERVVESKLEAAGNPEFPFVLSKLDHAIGGDGSAFMFSRDYRVSPRPLVSPAFYIGGFETIGHVFGDRGKIPLADVVHLKELFTAKLSIMMFRHSTCCNQFEYVDEDPLTID